MTTNLIGFLLESEYKKTKSGKFLYNNLNHSWENVISLEWKNYNIRASRKKKQRPCFAPILIHCLQKFYMLQI